MAESSLHLERLPHTVELRESNGRIVFKYVDQRRLPHELVEVNETDWMAVVDAICTLAVRGAPAIGIAGVGALALWAASQDPDAPLDESYFRHLDETATTIVSARPTAVNLKWAVDRAQNHVKSLAPHLQSASEAADTLLAFENELEREDEQVNRAIGAHGSAVLPADARVLTHCNAGSLATYFYGTALGIVYAAAEQGKVARVYADETRPVGQGARLTVWELSRVGIPVTLICDNMAASVMSQGGVDAVIVGADRIARNGDTANKIGTYGLAVLAHEHGIPFYVAAPTSTIDSDTSCGSDIVIEQRSAAEVLPEAIEGVDVFNPAFDVTPARYITGIVTENGMFSPERIVEAI